MAIGRTNAGGGGTSLNFKVVGGTTQPISPKENTIWVKTNLAIAAYELGKVSSPTWSMKKGFVYITIAGGDNTGGKNFNVIKETGKDVYVSVAGCIQNQDGTKTGWKRMDAYIYNSGKWTQFCSTFDGYLFNYGSVNTGVTGGWKSDGDGPVEAQSDGSVVVKPTTNYSEGIYHTVNKISLSGYSKLTMNGRLWETEGTYRAHICVWSEVTYGDYDQGLVASFTNADLRISSDKDYILDVSGLTGSYYIGVAVIHHPNYATIYMNTMKLT